MHKADNEQNVKMEELLEEAGKPENKGRPEERRLTATQHVLLGQYYQTKKDFNGAIDKYEKAVSLTPDRPKFHYLLANAYRLKVKEDNSLAYEEKRRLLRRAYKHYSEISRISAESKIGKKARKRAEEIENTLKPK